jgi:type II secretory pathway component PulF
MTKLTLNERFAFRLQYRCAFYTDIAAFMSANIPPYRALKQMEMIARKDKSTRVLARIYRRMMTLMEGDKKTVGPVLPTSEPSAANSKSKSFATAISIAVPDSEAIMLLGAERAGQEAFVMAVRELAAFLTRQNKATWGLRKAVGKAFINVAVIVGLVYFMSIMVVPILQRTAKPAMLEKMRFAPYYFTFCHGFVRWFPLFALVFIALLIASWASLPRWTPKFRYLSRNWFDRHLMPWTLYKQTQATFFLSGTAGMLRAKNPLKGVVERSVPHASPWYRYHLSRMIDDLTDGKSEVEAIAGGLLPKVVANRLLVYQLIPNFTEIMTRLADDTFTGFEQAIEQFSDKAKSWSVIALLVFGITTMFAIFDYVITLLAYTSAIRNSVH